MSIDRIKRLYWQKASLKSYNLSNLSIDDQIHLINETIHSQLNGPPSYDLTFIKKILQDVAPDDVYEEWYTLYTDKLGALTKDEHLIYRHYCYPLAKNELIEPCITIAENINTISHGQTGFRTWGASLEAINYFCQNIGAVKGKKVLELGSGCGLLGLFMDLMGADTVVMTDVEELIDRLHFNISLNTVMGNIKVVSYNWETHNDLPSEFHDTNILIAADVIYDPILIPHLVRVIMSFLEQDNSRSCIISQTIRQETTLALFIQLCSTNGIQLDLVNDRTPTGDEYFDFSETLSAIRIYKLYLVLP